MAKISLSISRDDEGKPQFQALQVDVPEGKIDAQMDGKVLTITYEGENAIITDVIDYLRNNAGKWFPGNV